jgi:uncharacterized integral membrane protein
MGLGWMWPSILVPIGVFFIGAVLMAIIITSDALDTKNKQ